MRYASELLVLFAALSLSAIACSDKGDDDDDATAGTGAVGTGGSAGSGTGGSSGSGTAGATPTLEFNFDSGLEGWAILTGDGASDPIDLMTTATVEWSADHNGSAKISVPFSGALQNVGFVLNAPGGGSETWDMTNKRLVVRGLLSSGIALDASHPAGLQPFAKGGPDWTWAQGEWTNLVPTALDVFVNAPLVFDEPTNGSDAPLGTYTSAEIKQLGVKIGTGDGDDVAFGPGVVYIDSIQVFNR